MSVEFKKLSEKTQKDEPSRQTRTRLLTNRSDSLQSYFK